MTKVTTIRNLPTFFDRDCFLTPFDKLFDSMFETNFPEFVNTVGVTPFQGSAYPKVNVYEYDDKVGIVAEIPGLDKKDLEVEVEEGVLTISGKKHSIGSADDKAKVLRRELKGSSFKRSFTLGDSLDGDNINAKFENGILMIDVPKIEPEQPKKTFVKIS